MILPVFERVGQLEFLETAAKAEHELALYREHLFQPFARFFIRKSEIRNKFKTRNPNVQNTDDRSPIIDH